MITSPFLEESLWQEIFRETWAFFERHYILLPDLERWGDPNWGTNITITPRELHPPFNMSELKRVFAAVAHFEPVLNMLNPLEDSRQGGAIHDYGNRSVLQRAAEPRPPAQIIVDIESISDSNEPRDFYTLRRLIQEQDYPIDIQYCRPDEIGFLYLLTGGCITAGDAIRSADVLLRFVKAALASRDIATVLRYPVSDAGLQTFMSRRPPNPLAEFRRTGTFNPNLPRRR